MNQTPSSSDHPHWENIRNKKQEIFNLREEVEKRQSRAAHRLRAVGNVLSHPHFFVAMVVAHAGWVAVNLPGLPWKPWDPYPFTFLATIASVEAPFIALLVLMHQQRSGRIEELREETNLQISLHIEHQHSITLRLLQEIEQRLGIDSDEDPELLAEMQNEMDPSALMEHLRQELRQTEGGSESTGP